MGEGLRGRIIRRPLENSRSGICRTVIRKTDITGAQTFGLTVAGSVTPKDCAPPRVPDSGEFRPVSLRSVARSTTTLHPPLIRSSAAWTESLYAAAAPFRSRNSPETGPDLTPARTRAKGHDLWTPKKTKPARIVLAGFV